MFRQGKVDSCVFSGVASAFSSLGDDKGAAVLAGLAEASAQCANPMAFLEKIVCQRTAWDVQGVSEGAYDVLEASLATMRLAFKSSARMVLSTIASSRSVNGYSTRTKPVLCHFAKLLWIDVQVKMRLSLVV